MTDDEIKGKWLARTDLHGGDLVLQLMDFAHAIIAKAVAEERERYEHILRISEPMEVATAVAKERERCANIAMGCRDELLNRSLHDWPNAVDAAEDIAESINND